MRVAEGLSRSKVGCVWSLSRTLVCSALHSSGGHAVANSAFGHQQGLRGLPLGTGARE